MTGNAPAPRRQVAAHAAAPGHPYYPGAAGGAAWKEPQRAGHDADASARGAARRGRLHLNNAKSSSSSLETIHAAHTVKFEVGIDTSRSRTVGGRIGVKFADLAGVEAKIQREILTRRTLSMSKEISYNQTTAVHILPSTHVRVRIRWKLMWEDGVVTVGLKFDKDTEDVT